VLIYNEVLHDPPIYDETNNKTRLAAALQVKIKMKMICNLFKNLLDIFYCRLYYSAETLTTCRVETLRRFQRFAVAIPVINVASDCSS
jgi:hypothetical protein